jgi:hypothetical protein
MSLDTSPTWLTIERGLRSGAWTFRWVEVRREAGAVVCRHEGSLETRSFARDQLLTEQEASVALQKARKT